MVLVMVVFFATFKNGSFFPPCSCRSLRIFACHLCSLSCLCVSFSSCIALPWPTLSVTTTKGSTGTLHSPGTTSITVVWLERKQRQPAMTPTASWVCPQNGTHQHIFSLSLSVCVSLAFPVPAVLVVSLFISPHLPTCLLIHPPIHPSLSHTQYTPACPTFEGI